jgi:hypothetical protein
MINYIYIYYYLEILKVGQKNQIKYNYFFQKLSFLKNIKINKKKIKINYYYKRKINFIVTI